MKYGTIGIVCPNCNYEFKNDVDNIKNRIDEINATIKDIEAQLGILKNATAEEQEARKQWKTNAYTKKRYLEKELFELKVKYKKLYEKREIKKFEIFRQIIKDFYGEKEYERCVEELSARENIEFLGE